MMAAHEGQAQRVRVAYDHPARMLEQHALQRAKSCRPRADDQHGILRPDISDLCGPKAGRQHIAHQQGLLVGHGGGNEIQALVGVGHAHIFRLSAVNAAAQRPSAVGIGAVVDPAMAAEIAFAAEGFHVHGHAVAGLYAGDIRACFLHHSHHFMAYGDAGHGPGHAAVANVQVAGADAGQRDAHDGVPAVLEGGAGFFHEFKAAPADVGIGEHGDLAPFGSNIRCYYSTDASRGVWGKRPPRP